MQEAPSLLFLFFQNTSFFLKMFWFFLFNLFLLIRILKRSIALFLLIDQIAKTFEFNEWNAAKQKVKEEKKMT